VEEKDMKRAKLVRPVITAVGILALSGVGLAQTPSQSHREASARAHEILSSAPCPLPRVTKDKITENEARDLAQQFADKNWAGFKVERPLGYGGGYTTMCYQTAQNLGVQPASGTSVRTPENRKSDSNTTVGKDIDQRTAYSSSTRPLVLYSVEYSMDLKNPAGETRNLCVDQFGTVSEFCSSFGMAGLAGPAGPAGAMGAQGPAGPIGPQAMAAAENRMVSFGTGNKLAAFKDILFDTDKSDIRSNEMSKITDIAAHVKQNAPMQVGIGGYADARGTDQHNQGLSERRVNAIRDALVKAGVANDKIQTSAFGEQKPLCNESTDACWQRDRRVDVGFRTGN
jgi:outer membrane protein OmpA-like peptidoglycan-associated protein